MQKVKQFFLHNRLQLGVCGVITLLIVARLWGWTLEMSTSGLETIRNLLETERYLGEAEEDNGEEYAVEYREEGAYLIDEKGNTVCGPYRYIEDVKSYSDRRFVGVNGLTGYLTADGKVLKEAIFTRADPMREGSACVGEGNESVYYIDKNGERFTRNYSDGYPFAETQGNYARVQLKDGSWAIINRQDKVILEADYVNELPCVTMIGTAVKNGNAIIFRLYGDEAEAEIVAMLEFADISSFFWDEYAFVENEKGLKGVVDCSGEILVPAKYVEIEHERVHLTEMSGDAIHLFKAYKADGTCDVFTLKSYW